jgi:hypothetical protein
MRGSSPTLLGPPLKPALPPARAISGRAVIWEISAGISTQRKAEKVVAYLMQYRYCDDGAKLGIV